MFPVLRLPWLGSVSTRFEKQENLLSNSAFPLWKHDLFTNELLYAKKQRCLTCFVEQQRGVSIRMPLRQSVCRSSLPKAAGLN